MSTCTFRLTNKRKQWEAILNERGQIRELRMQAEGRWYKIDFRSDDYSGPTWYIMCTDQV